MVTEFRGGNRREMLPVLGLDFSRLYSACYILLRVKSNCSQKRASPSVFPRPYLHSVFSVFPFDFKQILTHTRLASCFGSSEFERHCVTSRGRLQISDRTLQDVHPWNPLGDGWHGITVRPLYGKKERKLHSGN